MNRIQQTTEFRVCFVRGDTFVFDQGFRDVVGSLRAKGFSVYSPSFGQMGSQLTTEGANESLRVTAIRFIVENVFGQIKMQSKITAELLSNLSIPRFINQLEIICAIINEYHPRVRADRGHEVEICSRISSRMRVLNKLLALIETEGLFRVEILFRVYKPTESPIIPLTSNESYFLATGNYYSKLVEPYKARFRQMSLQNKVRLILV
ncbi:uncharacterized protein LOC141848891 [Brevipalpus obovatus]|uniref:uncharacterized protein LOC141848891 n=1 Tax=Brevipalpus obovatus TaxID=246614 RepID=UPI003D9E7315